MAKDAAPGYAIANEIGVRPIGTESQAKSVDSNLDDGIEKDYKAAIKAHKNLDDQSIDYSAKNGTLMLKGSVKTAAQKKEAAMLAKNIPNVKEVVDEIEVKPDKSSTAPISAGANGNTDGSRASSSRDPAPFEKTEVSADTVES